MAGLTDIENAATVMRITCGRKQPQHDLDAMRTFLRDVHSPCVARRPGIWDYRSEWLGPIRGDLFAPIAGVRMDCDIDEQVQFTSDVRWRDRAAFADTSRAPDSAVMPLLFADIGLLIAETTSYAVDGANGWTFVDRTGDPAPQGPPAHPSFLIGLRRSGDEAAFRGNVAAMAKAWAEAPGVLRLRMNLLDPPDMATAVKAPAPPHPVDRQFQALISLVVEDEAQMRSLGDVRGTDMASFLSAIQAYPVTETYTWNHHGRPTVAGLRGYPAAAAIRRFGADHQRDVGLLGWMYGHVVGGGPTG